ncbi:MAG: hypothetical protein ACI9JT_002387 [Polaribacter sp.]|jgi:hypothetical protein
MALISLTVKTKEMESLLDKIVTKKIILYL